jgi:hypothetical protein
MSSGFEKKRDAPDQFPQDRASENELENDSFDTRALNAVPRGLMHKRRHPIVWIGLALLLGGLIALVLSALVTG